MTIVICLDNNNGYQFGGKRQSADREVRNRILELDTVIRCDAYTASQVDEANRGRLYVGDDYLNTINGTCFVEKADVSCLKYDRLVVFRWNRSYPTTKKFAAPEGFRSVSKEDFTGYSHDRITMEVYVR